MNTQEPLQRPLASYGGTSNQQTERRDATQSSDEQIREKPCKCCLTYSRDENNCTKTGAAISIAQYLHNCTSEKKREFLKAYRENRIATHERYKQAHHKRHQLNKQIRRLEYNHSFNQTNAEWKQLNDTNAQQLQSLRVGAVIAAKKDHPDLDCGSLDSEYADVSEPQLQFDPQTDELPHTE